MVPEAQDIPERQTDVFSFINTVFIARRRKAIGLLRENSLLYWLSPEISKLNSESVSAKNMVL